MADLPASPQDPVDLDLVTASLRADAGDVDTFFQVLAAKLADSLRERVRLEREGGLFKRSDRIKRMQVQLGEWTLQAERGAGTVLCRVAHVVRGITLRTEEVGVDEWLATLARLLREESSRSATARAALDSLLS